MKIGLIIIGDEILSGKRQDKHLSRMIDVLSARGLQLAWANYLGDERELITSTLKRTFASDDLVFCTGGIGATPDDHTRQCAAAALDLEIALHPEAKKLIQERICDIAKSEGVAPDLMSADNQHRLKMGEFPVGARIIPNAFNKIPGFSLNHHHFMPGFPEMAWPMMEWVLDTYYKDLFHQDAHGEQALIVYEIAESRVTPLMEHLEAKFPKIKVFSLPAVAKPDRRSHIELGVKGEPAQVSAAFVEMCAALRELRAEFELI